MDHPLPSGAVIGLRPPSDLKSRDRDTWDEAYEQAIGISATLAGGHVDVAAAKPSAARLRKLPRRALLCQLITSWPYDTPQPTWAGGIENEGSLGELSLADEDAILALLEPYVDLVRQKPDPKDRPGATTTTSGSGSGAPEATSRQA